MIDSLVGSKKKIKTQLWEYNHVVVQAGKIVLIKTNCILLLCLLADPYTRSVVSLGVFANQCSTFMHGIFGSINSLFKCQINMRL